MTQLVSRPAEAPSQPGWSEARVAQLTRLWTVDGLCAAEIARRLGVSRNAVLGKIHRLGLSNTGPRPGAAPPRAQSNPKAHPKPRRHACRGPTRRPVAAKALAEVGPGLVPRLEALGAEACHWPIGDPKALNFAFCGRPAGRAIYCEAHRLLAADRGGRRRCQSGEPADAARRGV